MSRTPVRLPTSPLSRFYDIFFFNSSTSNAAADKDHLLRAARHHALRSRDPCSSRGARAVHVTVINSLEAVAGGSRAT